MLLLQRARGSNTGGQGTKILHVARQIHKKRKKLIFWKILVDLWINIFENFKEIHENSFHLKYKEIIIETKNKLIRKIEKNKKS